jgi:hypothetical protein
MILSRIRRWGPGKPGTHVEIFYIMDEYYVYVMVMITLFWRQIFDETGSKPVDPIVFPNLNLNCETSVTARLLALKSARTAACNSTKIL